jgi:phospholipid/cholesterol/gamma-HCH transport system substrate-binding protein
MNKLHFKVGLFTFATLAAGVAFVVYLLYARGFFEGTYTLQLAAASADGVAPGVPISFSGIEIGQVTSLGLNDGGGIVINAQFPARQAKWLKTDSTFTLDKPIVGGAKIRVESPHLDGAPLPNHSTMLLQTSDVTREIPALVERVKAILVNVEYLTRKDGEINATLANVKTVTGRMTGDYGVLEGVLGSADKARAVTDTLDKTRALMTRLDAMTAKTDQWLFARDGIADQSRGAVLQVRAMLVDAQASLKKADAVMQNAVAISANVKDGTQDLARLRSEIDDAVRKANGLVNEINRKWPFARDVGVKLP